MSQYMDAAEYETTMLQTPPTTRTASPISPLTRFVDQAFHTIPIAITPIVIAVIHCWQ